MSLLRMSFSGAVMILAVTFIRAAVLYRLPKRTFCALWCVVLARLLIPYTLPSAFSVYTLWAKAVQVAPRQGSETRAVLVMSGNAGEAVVSPSAITASPTLHVDPWLILWLVGLAVCGVFFVVTYFKCCRDFRTSLPVEQEFVSRWLGENRLHRPLSVRQSDRIAAPLTYGVLRPVILLPKNTDWTDEETLGYVLSHELAHIRYFDALTKLLLCAAACVHWFNPAVWLMFALANRDVELACDEAVLRRFGTETRSAYARVLIRMEERKSGFAPLCSNFNKNTTKERIVAIMKHKNISFAAVVAACALLVCVCAAFATSAPVRTVDRLADSVAYAGGNLSFTVPKGDGQWNILISGRKEMAGLGGMSVHYLENTDWESGKTYAFDVSGGEYTELWLDASLGNDEVSVDLTEWLPGELKADSSADSQ